MTEIAGKASVSTQSLSADKDTRSLRPTSPKPLGQTQIGSISELDSDIRKIIEDKDGRIHALESIVADFSRIILEKDLEIQALKDQVAKLSGQSQNGGSSDDPFGSIPAQMGPKLAHPTRERPHKKGRPGSVHHAETSKIEESPEEAAQYQAKKAEDSTRRPSAAAINGINMFGSINPAEVKLRSTTGASSAAETKPSAQTTTDVKKTGSIGNLSSNGAKMQSQSNLNSRSAMSASQAALDTKPQAELAPKPIIATAKPSGFQGVTKAVPSNNVPPESTDSKDKSKSSLALNGNDSAAKPQPSKIGPVKSLTSTTAAPSNAAPKVATGFGLKATSSSSTVESKPPVSIATPGKVTSPSSPIGSQQKLGTSAGASSTEAASSAAATAPSATAEEADLKKWIETTLKEQFPAGADFKSALKDGSILCKLANKLRKDGQSIKINPGKFSASYIENINNYLKCAGDVFKIPASQSFVPMDLYEGKAIDKVIKHLVALKKQVGGK